MMTKRTACISQWKSWISALIMPVPVDLLASRFSSPRHRCRCVGLQEKDRGKNPSRGSLENSHRSCRRSVTSMKKLELHLARKLSATLWCGSMVVSSLMKIARESSWTRTQFSIGSRGAGLQKKLRPQLQQPWLSSRQARKMTRAELLIK